MRFPSPRFLAAALAALFALAPVTQARALNAPSSSGYWKFSMHSAQWAKGTTVVYQDVKSGYGLTGSSFSSFDNTASSYTICNNTGASNTFTVKLYDSANFVTLLSQVDVTVENGRCNTYNIDSSANDQVSSFRVAW